MASTFPSEPVTKVGDAIVPIIVSRSGPEGELPLTFQGTGFIIAPDVLVTCWHCVSAPLSTGQRYAAVLPLGNGGYRALFLSNISKHPRGLDLAIATITHVPAFSLELSGTSVMPAGDVLTFGYPLSNAVRRHDGSIVINLEERVLRGYVTRVFVDADRGFGATEAYELDMPTPEGLSGAPLLRSGTKEVTGVIFGSIEVAVIKHFERFDDNGNPIPEVQRVVTFGLAHHVASLHSLSGPATGGLRLPDYIRRMTHPRMQPAT